MPIGYLSSFDDVDLGRPLSLSDTGFTFTKDGPVTVNVNIPIQLLVPIYADETLKDVAEELENCKLHTGVIADGPMAGCTLTSYANKEAIVRGVLTIPDNPVQIVFRFDQESNYLKIEMIDLEYAMPSQIRAAVKYIAPLQDKAIGHVRRGELTKEYNDAFMKIMRTQPEERARAKKLIKREFIAKHGKEFSRPFNEAMYRRGYKKHKKQR